MNTQRHSEGIQHDELITMRINKTTKHTECTHKCEWINIIIHTHIWMNTHVNAHVTHNNKKKNNVNTWMNKQWWMNKNE